MSDITASTFEVVSAHPDYTPNEVDFHNSTLIFRVSFHDYTVAVYQGADDSAFLWWTDGINEWLEHFVRVSHAIARFAHLQYCAESAWKQNFASHPKVFANGFEFLMQDRWI